GFAGVTGAGRFGSIVSRSENRFVTLTSAVTAMSRVIVRLTPALTWWAYALTVSFDITVMFGAAVLTNESRDRPPSGSGNAGLLMMICCACGHVSSLKFCSVRLLS